MTAQPPDDADRTNAESANADPTGGEKSATEVDAEFAAIISVISQHMSWDATETPRPQAGTATTTATDSDAVIRERDRRRALRRAEREAELTAFEAGRAEVEAELQADDAHFVPPDPPPVPRPKRRTVVALLILAVGFLMLIRPGLLQVTPDAVLVLGISCVVGGFGLLIYGLRPRSADPDDADGWDDGARL